jgi:hypothetical protein
MRNIFSVIAAAVNLITSLASCFAPEKPGGQAAPRKEGSARKEAAPGTLTEPPDAAPLIAEEIALETEKTLAPLGSAHTSLERFGKSLDILRK